MKTNQIMESFASRTLQIKEQSVVIKQRTKDSFFALGDVIKAVSLIRVLELGDASPLRIERYFVLESTKEFIAMLRDKKNCEPYIRARGRSKESWIHPYIMIDILLWANPSFKVEVYDWLNDFLISNRISSGDSWNTMCGALYSRIARKCEFSRFIQATGAKIKNLLGVKEWNKASIEELRRRDELQTFIGDLAETLQNSEEAVRLGLINYKRKYLEAKK